jgi:hypothetical protein
MAYTFAEAQRLLETIKYIEPGSIFVEIGSDRGEESTQYLAGQAQTYNTVLYTVDVDDYASKTIKHPAVEFFIEPGSSWVRHTWPSMAKKISLLHLDNFDWIWDINNIPNWIDHQITTYRERFNITMNNENCQQEHLEQLLGLAPWLADECLILMDDTFLHNGGWTGKCGPGVIYLKTQGFRVVKLLPSNGVVLARGYKSLATVDTTIQIL